jgi:hypothetical protein
VENYVSLVSSLTKNSTLLMDLVGLLLDWQYESYLVKGLPQAYLDEFQGIADGAASVDMPIVSTYLRRGVTVASIATGDIKDDLLYLLLHEFSAVGDAARAAADRMGLSYAATAEALADVLTPMGRTCSMFGVWGSRTADGNLMTGRNLDWESDTGVSRNKVVTVFKITGGIPYASIGFAGITGYAFAAAAAAATASSSIVLCCLFALVFCVCVHHLDLQRTHWHVCSGHHRAW